MPIALCSDLRFRVHPFCGNRGGGLLREKSEDRDALRKCKKKSPKKLPTKKKGRKNQQRFNKLKMRGRKRRKRRKGLIKRSRKHGLAYKLGC